jgi:hypothetical protein
MKHFSRKLHYFFALLSFVFLFETVIAGPRFIIPPDEAESGRYIEAIERDLNQLIAPQELPKAELASFQEKMTDTIYRIFQLFDLAPDSVRERKDLIGRLDSKINEFVEAKVILRSGLFGLSKSKPEYLFTFAQRFGWQANMDRFKEKGSPWGTVHSVRTDPRYTPEKLKNVCERALAGLWPH